MNRLDRQLNHLEHLAADRLRAAIPSLPDAELIPLIEQNPDIVRHMTDVQLDRLIAFVAAHEGVDLQTLQAQMRALTDAELEAMRDRL